MVDRIKKLIEIKGLTPSAFARLIEINRSGLTHIFSGRNMPSLDLVSKTLQAFPDISSDWLLFGQGEMFRAEEVTPVDSPQTSHEREFMRQGDLFADISSLTHGNIDDNQKTLHKEGDTKEEKVQNVKSGGKALASPVVKVATTSKRGSISKRSSGRVQKNDSQEVKKVKKIVFIYSDDTFKILEAE